MKTVLNFTPVFTPASKTLDFNLYSGFDLKRLFAVINITRNQIIYAVGQSTYGYSNFSSGVLTLVFDTSLHNSLDQLMIIYEDASMVQLTQDNTLASLNSTMIAMTETLEYFINSFLNQTPRLDQSGRMSVTVGAMTGTNTLTNVTNVGNLNNMITGNTAGIPYYQTNIQVIYDKIVTA